MNGTQFPTKRGLALAYAVDAVTLSTALPSCDIFQANLGGTVQTTVPVITYTLRNNRLLLVDQGALSMMGAIVDALHLLATIVSAETSLANALKSRCARASPIPRAVAWASFRRTVVPRPFSIAHA